MLMEAWKEACGICLYIQNIYTYVCNEIHTKK